MKLLIAVFASFLVIVPTYAVTVSIVSHVWITKIVDSHNNVTIRPGSVYEINTYFEQILDGLKPKFKYIFRDTGLGAADPIYPIFQKGHQESWGQLLPAMWTDKKRHIDHYSKVETPEGCIVHSAYWVRHIDEFPDRWHQERKEGYTLVDIGFDYYESPTPDILCGRHQAHPLIDDKNNPLHQLKTYAKNFNSYDSIPESLLSKFESKIGLLKLVNEEFDHDKWPKYDTVYNLNDNSMWYYKEHQEPLYGHDKPMPQPHLSNLKKPSDFFIETNDFLKENIKLSSLINDDEFKKLLNHLNGKPSHQFNASLEPGSDFFSVSQVNNKHIYTHGLDLWKIKNIDKTISNPENFKLVSIVVRPYQDVNDRYSNQKIIPQLRFVFQLHDPEKNALTEQLFIHLMYDGADRNKYGIPLKWQHKRFLLDYDKAINNNEQLLSFIDKYTSNGVQDINFSSSLTGIWVFGSLSRTYDKQNTLQSIKIHRQGIDVGYYSTIWDTELFRERIRTSSDLKQKQKLEQYIDNLSPSEYRDPKRHDVNRISFNEVTCAGCHQMSGRDGVHMSMNDNIDPRIQSKTRITQFMVKELARQLEFGQTFW